MSGDIERLRRQMFALLLVDALDESSEGELARVTGWSLDEVRATLGDLEAGGHITRGSVGVVSDCRITPGCAHATDMAHVLLGCCVDVAAWDHGR